MILEYIALFATGFLAGSILPMQSEAVFAGMLLSGRYAAVYLLFTVSLGNVLGSVLNWWIGRNAEKFMHKKWLSQKPAQLDRARRWFDKYGAGVLLLSWLPVIGDPLTVVAGVLGMRLSVFLAVVTLAKTARYAVLMLILL